MPSSNKKSRIPTRRGDSDTLQSPKKSYASSANAVHSNTLNNRSSSNGGHHNIRQSTSYGNLVLENESDADFLYRTMDHKNGNIIKRTKSFWKFGKSGDDILEGMAMWKHRDLVQTENERNVEEKREATLKRRKSINNTISTNSSETLKNGTAGEYIIQNGKAIDDSAKYHLTKSEIDQRISMQQQVQKQQHQLQQQQQQLQQQKQQQQPPHQDEDDDEEEDEEDESIYDVQPKQRAQPQPQQQQPQQIMSRSKLIRQSYNVEQSVETDHEIRRQTSNTLQPQQQQQRNDKYRRSESKIPYSSGGQQQQQTAAADPIVSSQINTNTKKKTKKTTSKPAADPIEYYDRETPDTMSHGFDDSSMMMNENTVHVRDTSFYDDESVDDMTLMKTVKRQEILKQYYSSGTDTEQQSSSSDPYDCIVVEDHLVRRSGGATGAGAGNVVEKHLSKDAKMEFKTFRGDRHDDKDSGMESSRTGTLLPRTKLSKNVANASTAAVAHHQTAGKSEKAKRSARDRGVLATTEKQQKQQQQQQMMQQQHRTSDLDPSSKSYGPWYDLWGKDIK